MPHLSRLPSLTVLIALGLVGCDCKADSSIRAEINPTGTPPTCVGETADVRLSWNTIERPQVSLETDFDPNVMALAIDGELGPGTSATLAITCVNPGTTRLDVDAIATSDGDRILVAGIQLDIECELCVDAGTDGAAPDAGPPPRAALSFGASLLPDGLDDYIDSSEPSPGYTGADIEVLEFGTEIEAQSMADADTDFNMSTFECGERVGEQWTVCAPTPVVMSAGELVTVVIDLEGSVPFDAADAHYIYAAVFESDGDPANDFVPEAGFPRDFFQGTDRWYELIWDTSAWTVRVTQLDSAGTRTEVPSSVRAVVEGERIQFFIDRAELPSVIPGYRVSAFRHDGSFTVATRGGDVSMGTPTLPLLPAGCGFLGAECRDDGLDRGRDGALASCGDTHSCSLVIQPGSFRGACTPDDVPRCGMGAGSCDGDLTCASPADRAGWCLTDEQLACLCSTPSGRVVVPACDP